jgi:glycerophosphoryl diester phosphodiesterase
MPALPESFLSIPVAHRGLHGPGIPENSLAAAEAAIAAGFGIELDIQPASDGTPMVFHDYDLARLVGDEAMIADFSPAALAEKRLLGTDQPIPTFAQFLDLVAGRVPLLVEIKDQDGRMGPDIGQLHERVADLLRDYQGPVALMSFNPHITEAFHKVAPEIAVGITSCGYAEDDWPMLTEETRRHLGDIADFDRSGSSFISHDKTDLDNPRVDALKSMGVPILCWTIKSPDQETASRQIADNITFEGYLPA